MGIVSPANQYTQLQKILLGERRWRERVNVDFFLCSPYLSVLVTKRATLRDRDRDCLSLSPFSLRVSHPFFLFIPSMERAAVRRAVDTHRANISKWSVGTAEYEQESGEQPPALPLDPLPSVAIACAAREMGNLLTGCADFSCFET